MNRTGGQPCYALADMLAKLATMRMGCACQSFLFPAITPSLCLCTTVYSPGQLLNGVSGTRSGCSGCDRELALCLVQFPVQVAWREMAKVGNAGTGEELSLRLAVTARIVVVCAIIKLNDVIPYGAVNRQQKPAKVCVGVWCQGMAGDVAKGCARRHVYGPGGCFLDSASAKPPGRCRGTVRL